MKVAASALSDRGLKREENEDQHLIEAGIARAKGVAICLPNDKDNLYLVVSVRQANPSARIVARGCTEHSMVIGDMPFGSYQESAAQAIHNGNGGIDAHVRLDQERFQILDILKPDYIKVDGELMHTLMTDTGMQAAVQRIVAAAPDLLTLRDPGHAELAGLPDGDWKQPDADAAAGPITWERLLLDLHAARFLGPAARWFTDLMAALIVLLVGGGIWLYRLRGISGER